MSFIRCIECGMIWPDDYDATHCDCGVSIDENCFYYDKGKEQMPKEDLDNVVEVNSALRRFPGEANVRVKVGDKYHDIASIEVSNDHRNSVAIIVAEVGETVTETSARIIEEQKIQVNQPEENIIPVVIPKEAKVIPDSPVVAEMKDAAAAASLKVEEANPASRELGTLQGVASPNAAPQKK